MSWVLVLCAGVGGLAAGRLARWAARRACPPASLRAFRCELVTAAVAVLVVGCLIVWDARAAWAPLPVTVGVLAAPLTLTDLRYRRLPDTLTLPAYPLVAVAVLAAAFGLADPEMLGRAAVVAVVFGGVHAVARFRAPGSMGAGDVKLAGSLGAVLGASGWAAMLPAIGIAACVSLLLAGVAFARRKSGDGRVPYGPGLLAGTLVVSLLAGAG